MGESWWFVEMFFWDEGFWVNGEVFFLVLLIFSWEVILIKDYIEVNFKNNFIVMVWVYGIC